MKQMNGWGAQENRAVLRLSGVDVQSFLQGMITNDMALLDAQPAMLAAMLTPQGKFLTDFFVVRDGEDFLLEIEHKTLAATQKKLALYRLRADVSMTVEEGLEVAVLLGDAASQVAAFEDVGMLCYADPRCKAMGVRLIGSKEALAQGAKPLAALKQADYDRWRIEQGIPEGSADAKVGESFLLENHYDQIHGVSFRKGCYVGQEVTARMHHRGGGKKSLYRVRAEAGALLPESGVAIMAGGATLGEMRSSAGGVGFALLRMDKLKAAQEAGNAVLASDALVQVEAI